MLEEDRRLVFEVKTSCECWVSRMGPDIIAICVGMYFVLAQQDPGVVKNEAYRCQLFIAGKCCCRRINVFMRP